MHPTPHAAPPPGDARLVVRSIGRAPLSIHRPLLPLMGTSAADVVGRLYRAPSVLLDGVDGRLAEQLSTILRDGGLDTVVEPRSAPFTPGEGDRDVALHLREPGRLRAVAAEIAGFLGCDLATAARVLCSSPALLVGQVSAATVAALEARLAPLEVELDVSLASTAVYDLFLAEEHVGSRAIVVASLRALGNHALAAGPMVASGLSRSAADHLWKDLHHRLPIRLVDQAFERFDVRLERAPATPELEAALVRLTGMPARVAKKIPGKLPIVLLESVRRDEAHAALAALAEVGALASANLLTFQTLSLVLELVPEPSRVGGILGALLELPEPEVQAGLRRLPWTIQGPFTPAQARWLRAELSELGVQSRLELR